MSETRIDCGKNYWVWKKHETFSEIYYSKYDKTLVVDNQDIDLIFNGTRFVGWFQGDLFVLNKKLIHRVIMERIGEDIKGKVVDHINGNQRNNRRCNLRTATRSQNSGNRIGTGTSQYLGVYWHKQIKHWCTRIFRDGELKFLKTFKDELDAALAYNTQIVNFCEFAPQNDLTKGYSNASEPNRPRDFRKDKAKITKEENGVLEIYYPKYDQTTLIDKKFLWLLEGKTNHLIGNICGNYLQVMYKRKFWKFHRLIWTLEFGEIPEDRVIDHINLEANNNNNVYPLLVCKQIDTPIFKFADVIKASVQCTTRAVFLWQIHINPSFAGDELTFNSITDSSLQFAVPTNSTTISSTDLGQIAFSGYFQQSGGSANINEVWLPELDETPTFFESSGRVVAFSVQKVTGGAEEYIGSLTFKERISK